MLENLTERARRTLFFARYEAARAGAEAIASDHVLLGLLRESDELVEQLFERFQLDPGTVRAELQGDDGVIEPVETRELPLADEARRVLMLAAHEAEVVGHTAVGNEHLLLGILRIEGCVAAQVLTAHGMTLFAVREELGELLKERESRRGKRELASLSEFARDLTDEAAAGVFDPLVGREDEVDRVIQVLLRRSKNNPILLGEPGVGKTAIVEGLAQRIASGRVPVQLADRRILALDLSLVVAGTKYRGQFEERLKAILKELRENPEIVVFIDELHVLVGAGSAEGSLDAANILKPALSRGEITCIGATTLKEYRKYIEKDRSLSRRFQPVTVNPPDEAGTMAILEGLRERYEQFHRVTYSEEALRAAVEKSGRYLTDRFFPDKAIDVLDEAGARVKLRGAASTEELRTMQGEATRTVREMKRAISAKDFEAAVRLRERELALRSAIRRLTEAAADGEAPIPEVNAADIEEVIATWTGVPVATMREDEAQRLSRMEELLKHRVVGQREAISLISKAIRRSRLGVTRGQRPIGSFLFLGPSGVGKTEVARQLARFLFQSEKALLRFDMSEYMERHAVSKLIGSPPGYVGFDEGGQLTERVRRQPYSVILLDEIEKAHPDLSNLMLQILEDGVLTDAYGDRVDFTNALIIMTSNLGTRDLLAGPATVGFGGGRAFRHDEIRDVVLKELKRHFSPEFLNRLDEVVVFHPLELEHLREICGLLVHDVAAHMALRGVLLDAGDDVVDWLLGRADLEVSAGARPLRRAVRRYLEDAVSDYLIEHRDAPHEHLDVRVGEDRLIIASREGVCEG